MLPKGISNKVLFVFAMFSTLAPIVTLVIALVMTILNAIRLHKQYKIGERMQAECGNEYTESESSRYYIYDVFTKKVSPSLYTSFLLMMISFIFTMVFSMFLLIWSYLVSKTRWDELKEAKKGGTTEVQSTDVKGAMNDAISSIQNGELNANALQNVGTAFAKKAMKTGMKLSTFTPLGKGMEMVSKNVLKEGGQVDDESIKKARWLLTQASSHTLVMVLCGFAYMITLIYYTVEFVKQVASMSKISDSPSITDNNKEQKKLKGLMLSSIVFFPLYLWMKILTPADHYGNKLTNDWYFGAFVALYVVVIVYTIVIRGNYSRMIMAITSDYRTSLNKFDENVKTLASNTNTVIEDYFGSLIRTVTKENDDSKTLFTKYKDAKLLGRVIPHKDGKELDDLETSLKGEVDKQVFIDIRKSMRDLRGKTDNMVKEVKIFMRNMFIAAVLLVGGLLYMIYHKSYSNNPMKTVVGSGLIIIVLTVVISWYGWFSSAVML